MEDLKTRAFKKAGIKCHLMDRDLHNMSDPMAQMIYLVAIETWAGAMLEQMKKDYPLLKPQIGRDYLMLRKAFQEKIKSGEMDNS